MRRGAKAGIGIGAVIFFAIIAMFFGRYQSEYIDRYDPFVRESTAYLKISPHTRTVENAIVVDENGDDVPYRLTFTTFGDDSAYVKIYHRGLYVSSIDTLEEAALPEPVRAALSNQ